MVPVDGLTARLRRLPFGCGIRRIELACGSVAAPACGGLALRAELLRSSASSRLRRSVRTDLLIVGGSNWGLAKARADTS
jgi:hypothetical protein